MIDFIVKTNLAKTVSMAVFTWMLLLGCTTGIPFGEGDLLVIDAPALPAPDELTIISWNIKKNDENNPEIAHLISKYDPDLLCFQEVMQDTCMHLADGYRECRFAPSWQDQRRNAVTGVLTLSRFELTSARPLLSPGREFFFFTPKSSLITTLTVKGGRSLMIINVHLLNFVPLSLVEYQMEKLYDQARHHHGPMIVCGDFNTWNGKRLEQVLRFAARLDLVKPLALSGKGGTAPDWLFLFYPILGINTDAPLDHVFCRGLEIIEFDRLTRFESSDHDPLLLKVRIRD